MPAPYDEQAFEALAAEHDEDDLYYHPDPPVPTEYEHDRVDQQRMLRRPPDMDHTHLDMSMVRSRFVKLTYGGMLRYTGPEDDYMVYLGNRYDNDEIDYHLLEWQKHPDVLPDVDSDMLALLALLRLPVIDQRAQYRFRLEHELRNTLKGGWTHYPGASFDALRMEYAVWSALDKYDTARYISMQLGPIDDLLARKDEHWIWPEPPHPRKRPAVNWHHAKGIPVYKLLWPYVYPHDPLPPRSKKKAVKLPHCPDAEFRQCVNPRHYEVAWHPWGYLTEGMRGRRDVFPTGRSLRWNYIEHVKDINGTPLLHCPVCNAVASTDYQAQVAAGVVRGTMRCFECIQRWKLHHGDRRARVGKKAVPGEWKSEKDLQFERDLINEVLKHQQDPFEIYPDDPA